MKKNKWDVEKMRLGALQYSTKWQLKKENYGLYKAAYWHGVWEEITSHMPKNSNIGRPAHNRKWHEDILRKEALKYNTRSQFQLLSTGAYKSARRRGLLDEICGHMEPYDSKKMSRIKTVWTKDRILEAAKTCKYRSEFKEKFNTAYIGARRMKILSKCCKHMKYKSNSTPEMEMKETVKGWFPTADSLKVRHIEISGKPHIKGFDIDVYVKEKGKGIEFDGEYHHSPLGLKRSRPHWPQSDIDNYHKIKDLFFKSVYGIKILHIKETEWNKSKKRCITRIKKFLGVEDRI